MCDVEIRKAVVSDCGEIAELLCNDLGYNCSDELVERKLSNLNSETEVVFVAVAGGKTAGVVHAQKYDLLYFETMVNILALAVSEDRRRTGIGAELMNAAESWAKEIGASAVRLNSGSTRKGAHNFYRAIGYISEKPQLRFMKKL